MGSHGDRKRSGRGLAIFAAILTAAPSLALEGWTREGDRWIKHVLKGDRRVRQWTNQLAYKLSVPGDYDPKSRKKLATVVHYHGYGGKKSTTTDPKGLGSVFGKLWMKQAEPIIGIFPRWDGTFWGLPEVTRKLMEVLNYEKSRLRIDPDRIYITGQSMGGYGTWSTAGQYPEFFAAAAPFSGEWGPFGKGGRSSVPKDLRRFRRLPYWAAHGMKDNVVLHKDDLACVEQMRRGGVYTRYTAYPRGGHHVKQIVYAKQVFFDWMLAQKRGTLPNYELSVDDGKGPKVVGFFEPKTARKITARAPDKAKDEVFAGWTCASGSTFEHTTTNPLTRKARFGNSKALTTTFTMPEGDVIVTANYRVGGK